MENAPEEIVEDGNDDLVATKETHPDTVGLSEGPKTTLTGLPWLVSGRCRPVIDKKI